MSKVKKMVTETYELLQIALNIQQWAEHNFANISVMLKMNEYPSKVMGILNAL
jgi:hypothetical protein